VPSSPRPLSNVTNTAVTTALVPPAAVKQVEQVEQLQESVQLMALIMAGLTEQDRSEAEQQDGQQEEWEDLEEMTDLIEDEQTVDDTVISDVAAKWMAIVDDTSDSDSPEEEEHAAGSENIFAVDIIPAAAAGLEALVEEEEEEEESLLEISLLPEDTTEGAVQQAEEKVSSPWDRYISAAEQEQDGEAVDRNVRSVLFLVHFPSFPIISGRSLTHFDHRHSLGLSGTGQCLTRRRFQRRGMTPMRSCCARTHILLHCLYFVAPFVCSRTFIAA